MVELRGGAYAIYYQSSLMTPPGHLEKTLVRPSLGASYLEDFTLGTT